MVNPAYLIVIVFLLVLICVITFASGIWLVITGLDERHGMARVVNIIYGGLLFCLGAGGFFRVTWTAFRYPKSLQYWTGLFSNVFECVSNLVGFSDHVLVAFIAIVGAFLCCFFSILALCFSNQSGGSIFAGVIILILTAFVLMYLFFTQINMFDHSLFTVLHDPPLDHPFTVDHRQQLH